MGLLFDERPLVLSPTLALALGNLNEAVFVQQLHYWIEIKKQTGKNYIDGSYWVYNSYEEWLKQFPWMSIATLRRTIDSLVKKGYIIKGNYNQKKMDHTTWYTLNYKLISEIDKKSKQQKDKDAKLALEASKKEENNENTEPVEIQDSLRYAQNEQIDVLKSADRCDQNDQIDVIKMSRSMCSKRADRCDQNDQSNTIDYPIDYPKTTSTETMGDSIRPSVEEEEVLDFYNKTCTSFPTALALTQHRRDLIRHALSEGITFTQIQEAFRKAEQSDFLSGRIKGAEWTRFDFDWFIQPSSIINLLEGRYDNVPAQKQKRIEQNQALSRTMYSNSTSTEPLTEEAVSQYSPFLKDALKRHNRFPDSVSQEEA